MQACYIDTANSSAPHVDNVHIAHWRMETTLPSSAYPVYGKPIGIEVLDTRNIDISDITIATNGLWNGAGLVILADSNAVINGFHGRASSTGDQMTGPNISIIDSQLGAWTLEADSTATVQNVSSTSFANNGYVTYLRDTVGNVTAPNATLSSATVAGNLSAASLFTSAVNIGAPLVTAGNTYPVLTNPPYNLGFDTSSGTVTASFWLASATRTGAVFSAFITNGANPLVVLGLATNQAATGVSSWDSGTSPTLIHIDDSLRFMCYYSKIVGKATYTKWRVTGGNVWSNLTANTVNFTGGGAQQYVATNHWLVIGGTLTNSIYYNNGTISETLGLN